MASKKDKERVAPLFIKINIHLIEVYGEYEFYVGDSLSEFGYDATIVNIHRFSDTKQILIIKNV
jgi:hypothetical protein